jgi:uncharacterized protein
MTDQVLVAGEFHRFEAADRTYVYLVPSAAVFALDETALSVLDTVAAGAGTREQIVERLSGTDDRDGLHATIDELLRVRALQARVRAVEPRRFIPLTALPLQTLVLNVTNQCNLACTYCYEYGEDKIVDTANGPQPKFMSEETSRASVELLLRESGPVAHLTFFGGETLMNFPVLRATVEYARRRAGELGKTVEFSVTTNATLLRPEIIDFLADHDIGVTISIDGPPDLQDRFRVFHGGQGSYDVVAPKIKALLARHKTRPIGARVTLTRQTLDVVRIFRHLVDDMGFWEVGFAPVTTSPSRAHAIADEGFDRMLGQFRELAYEFRDAAIANRRHGFSNVRDTVEEIHKGASKAFPCGAGFGLLGVATDGAVGLCHRFAGSDEHRFGSIHDGIDRAAQRAFLDRHHIDDKTDCATCWARPLCAGGCYHEAHTRYGDTAAPNLHYCEWIRGWTDTCLKVYGEIAAKNPRYLRQFDTSEDHHEAPHAD